MTAVSAACINVAGEEKTVPLSPSELLRLAYEVATQFETLHLKAREENGGVLVHGSAWFARQSGNDEKILMRAEDWWTSGNKETRRQFLKNEDGVYRILEDKALKLEFSASLPRISRAPPIVDEYRRILRYPTQLQHFEVTENIIQRGVECHKLTFTVPSVSEARLQLDAEKLKKQKLEEATQRNASDEEFALLETFDFYESIRRGKVAMQVFYFDKENYFNFGWKFYNADGELLAQHYYDAYELNIPLDDAILSLPAGLKEVVVKNSKEYNEQLRLKEK